MSEQSENRKKVFKEYWFQITVLGLLLIISLSIVGRYFMYKIHYDAEITFKKYGVETVIEHRRFYSRQDFKNYMPDSSEVKSILNNLAIDPKYQKQVDRVCDVINEKISKEEDLRAMLHEEEKKLSADELKICYMDFFELSRPFIERKYRKYPYSTVDSLSCVLMYSVFNKK